MEMPRRDGMVASIRRHEGCVVGHKEPRFVLDESLNFVFVRLQRRKDIISRLFSFQDFLSVALDLNQGSKPGTRQRTSSE
jgi:hypothetical protein